MPTHTSRPRGRRHHQGCPCALARARTIKHLYSPPLLSLDGSVPYRFGQQLRVPPAPGVYLIHDMRGVLYAGRSHDLRLRFHQHYWTPGNPWLAVAIARPVGVQRFSWCIADGPDQVDLERRVIRAFEPPCNRLLYAGGNVD